MAAQVLNAMGRLRAGKKGRYDTETATSVAFSSRQVAASLGISHSYAKRVVTFAEVVRAVGTLPFVEATLRGHRHERGQSFLVSDTRMAEAAAWALEQFGGSKKEYREFALLWRQRFDDICWQTSDARSRGQMRDVALDVRHTTGHNMFRLLVERWMRDCPDEVSQWKPETVQVLRAIVSSGTGLHTTSRATEFRHYSRVHLLPSQLRKRILTHGGLKWTSLDMVKTNVMTLFSKGLLPCIQLEMKQRGLSSLNEWYQWVADLYACPLATVKYVCNLMTCGKATMPDDTEGHDMEVVHLLQHHPSVHQTSQPLGLHAVQNRGVVVDAYGNRHVIHSGESRYASWSAARHAWNTSHELKRLHDLWESLPPDAVYVTLHDGIYVLGDVVVPAAQARFWKGEALG